MQHAYLEVCPREGCLLKRPKPTRSQGIASPPQGLRRCKDAGARTRIQENKQPSHVPNKPHWKGTGEASCLLSARPFRSVPDLEAGRSCWKKRREGCQEYAPSSSGRGRRWLRETGASGLAGCCVPAFSEPPLPCPASRARPTFPRSPCGSEKLSFPRRFAPSRHLPTFTGAFCVGKGALASWALHQWGRGFLSFPLSPTPPPVMFWGDGCE